MNNSKVDLPTLPTLNKGGVVGSFPSQSSVPTLKLNKNGGSGSLKSDKHPFSGRARITIETWSVEDDGWGGEEMEYETSAYILSVNECIQLRDQLTERIEKDLFCTIEDKKIRCKIQCTDCARIQAGLPE